MLDKVNLEIREGEFFSLLGASGCGKTTLLRIIAGLETPTSGEIYWQNKQIDQLKSQARPFNMVFQKYALFPHLTVFDNIAFGLRIRGHSKEIINDKVEKILRLVEMSQFADRKPETLSGGQAQRVAVARAAVNEPQILLLDEPLSALDQKMREHMQSELRELQQRLKITFILVTHDQEEALSLSDRIAVMNQGRIEQVATPRELYENPKTHFVAKFVGSMGCVSGALAATASSEQALATIQMQSGEKILGQWGGRTHKATQTCDAFVRPENVMLKSSTDGSKDNRLEVEITNIAFKGLHFDINLITHDKKRLKCFAKISDEAKSLQVGQRVQVYFKPTDTFIFEQPGAQ